MKRRSKTPRRKALPDTPPRIVGLLRRVFYWDDPAVSDEARRELREQIGAILAAWDKREDPAELRRLLGPWKRGGRRTQSAVNDDLTLALAYAAMVAQGARDPLGSVCNAYDIDEKRVERANTLFASLAQKLIAATPGRMRWFPRLHGKDNE